jgi:hypothetical protein
MASRNVLKKGLAEFVLIVAGVLVALAVDGYATRRAETAAEVEFLRRVADDLRQNDAALERFGSRAEEQGRRLADLVGRLSNDEEIPDSVLDAALSARARWTVAKRGVAAISMQEALQSGRLSLLDRHETRMRLQLMATLWQDWVEVEDAYRRLVEEHDAALVAGIDSVGLIPSLNMRRPITADVWPFIDQSEFDRMLRDEIVALGRWLERASTFQEGGRNLANHLDSLR